MTAANTQHWPYMTGLKPLSAHWVRMSPLPVHVDGSTPCVKSPDHFPFSTPRSSSELICTATEWAAGRVQDAARIVLKTDVFVMKRATMCS